MTDRELMQMALDAIEAALSDDQPYISRSKETVEALRSRLAQPEQEPYGYIVRRNWKTPTFIEADNVEDAGLPYNNPNYEPVFKAPPQPEPMIDGWPLYSGLPKREFQFSTIEEAMQPMPPTPEQPQLTDDETLFANAFTTLIKAGYGKEAETILKCKPAWQGLTDEEIGEIADDENYGYMDVARAIQAKLKEKNG